MDFRLLHLNLGRHGYWDLDFATKGRNEILGALPSVFPRLRCILLDGVPSLDMSSITRGMKTESLAALLLDYPTMLSARHGQTMFLSAYLASTHVKDLVYLDLSYMPGSLRYELERMMLHRQLLPCLRILKVQGHEMDSHTGALLVDAFETQLWSLDLSNNRLTDGFLKHIMAHNFGASTNLTSVRNDAQYDVEGRQVLGPGGNEFYGRFAVIEESEHSGTFSHPRRHLVDPPMYTREEQGPTQRGTFLRHNGRKRVTPDSCEEVKQTLVGAPGQLPQGIEVIQGNEIFRGQSAITHLRLSDNEFSARQIERMLRDSPGHLEVFECGSTRLDIPKTSLPPFKAFTFSGFIGGSHLLRPVFSVNLQVLRIHHSLITHIPSIKGANIPAEECLWLAETLFEPRASMAFPQVYQPDMNPRLYSLTLTGIPRYSSGSLISKLISFLELASAQERAIQDADVTSSYRSPATVRGLRHLRLEVGQDVREGRPDVLDFQDLDAGKLASLDSTEFSFFGESGWTTASPTTSKVEPPRPSAASSFEIAASHPIPTTEIEMPPPESPVRLNQFPFNETTDDHLTHTEPWKGEVMTVPVWIGSGIPGPHAAVNEYMRVLCDPSLHTNVGPASPCHVQAGVPAGSYLFHAAWDALLVPPSLRRPTTDELAAMSDVVWAIKQYRAKTRAALATVQETAGTLDVALGEPHFHWTGKLEVSCPTT
jgi:hypothetical protein